MREKIILAPSANSTELLRTLARYGINTLGTRIMTSVELAEYALMRTGITITEQYVRSNMSASLIFSFLHEINFFSSASYNDAQNINTTLDSIRRLIPENESENMHKKLSEGEFTENNAALAQVYDKYISELKSRELIDGIQVIRRAIANSARIDADFISLREFPLTVIDSRLIDKLAAGNYRTISLCELLHVNMGKIHFSNITEAYGTSNEVGNIISTILKDDISLDSCIVACTDPASYSQLFYELSQLHNIPVTFGNGLPITNSAPAKLLHNYMIWETSGLQGIKPLNTLVNSDSFEKSLLLEKLAIDDNRLNDLIKLCGNLRISTDAASNMKKLSACECAAANVSIESENIELVKLIAHEFEQGCSYIIKTYSHIREGFAGKLDRSAMNVICNELDAYSSVPNGNISDIIPGILQKSVCSENSCEGHLHITGIGQAICSLRENLFAAGLSAENYPGSPMENYLITDNDMQNFGDDALTSERIIQRRKAILYDLLRTASALGNNICISYCGYDTAELKEVNASSVLFEIYKEQFGENTEIRDLETSLMHTEFFANGLSASDAVGRAYSKGKKLIPAVSADDNNEYNIITERKLSVSAIANYIKCQRKFSYSAIMGVNESSIDDPFMIIDNKDKGTIFHELMKKNASERMTLDDLLNAAGEMWDNIMLKRPPLNRSDAELIRNEFLSMAQYAYITDRNNEIIMAEEPMEYAHSSGITLVGTLDRLEKDADGKYIVADFKTGKSGEYKPNDFYSCIQILLYAYMLSKKGYKISGGEYRFLKEEKIIPCIYNVTTEQQIDNLLEEIAVTIKNNSYSYAEKCNFCGYKAICDKEVQR